MLIVDNSLLVESMLIRHPLLKDLQILLLLSIPNACTSKGNL